MRRGMGRASYALVVLVASALAAAPSLADKPSWANGGKHEEHGHHEASKHPGGVHGFSDHQERIVQDFYGTEIRGGKCPPGLAKKQNGCMAPGQARKWQLGHPLPHDAVTYELPHELVVELGVPPEGYRYVRVASDVLMIAVGTNMVVDAIHDLGQR
jgi:Ni/Co efflux regulator RcnB